MKKVVILLFVVSILFVSCGKDGEYVKKDLPELHGNWYDYHSTDINLLFKFNADNTGSLEYFVGNQKRIFYTWKYKSDAAGNPKYELRDDQSDNNMYCLLWLEYTNNENVDNPYDLFENKILYYCQNHNGLGPRILDLVDMHYCNQ